VSPLVARRVDAGDVALRALDFVVGAAKVRILARA